MTGVPELPIDGVNEVTVGALGGPMENGWALVTEPAGELTVIAPLVAPAGTEVTISVVDAEVTAAGVPLKETVSWLAVALNPVP